MNWTSKLSAKVPARLRSGLGLAAVAITVSVIAGSCATLIDREKAGEDTAQVRGYVFSHSLHVDQGLDDCSICHDVTSDTPGALSMPGHDLCSVCHEIPESGTEVPETVEERQKCDFCHVRDDYSVTQFSSKLSDEVIWDHAPHVNAELDCKTCHTSLDQGHVVKGSMKPWCMDCHGDTRPALNECSVCHSQMSKDAIPKFRKGQRIAHDAPEIWERVHGEEARVDPMFCALCHDQEQSCEACHSQQAPDDHTLAWRNRTHGLVSSWDRQRCAVCHEETFCIQCHRHSEPASHRAGWGEPLNRHCVNCHYPPEQNQCTVCHENISHESARPSLHNIGVFPPNCAQCHPAGLPHRAPHALNSTVHCVVCHK
jgi:predicted CXXCH cytochrome family protein